MKRALLSTLAVAGVFAAGLAVDAATSPAKAVDVPCNTAKVIVPWSPGGETDIVSRIFVESWNKQGLEPSLQVVNVSGQGGTKGAKEAKGARADGCTLFVIHQSILSSFLTGRIDFTWDAYVPVARMVLTPQLIAAASDTEYDDFKDLKAHAENNPNKVIAGATLGSTSHFGVLLTADALGGVKFKYVSYEGTAERLQALLSKVIDIGQASVTSAEKYIEGGEMKALAFLADERSPELPDVPTAKEQGFDLIFGTVRGFVLPAGASDALVAQYEAGFEKVANDPGVIRQIKNKGSQMYFAGADAYTDWWGEVFGKWKQLAIDVGMYKGS